MADIVIVCIPSAGAASEAPCGPVDGVAHVPVMAERVAVTEAQAAALDAWGTVDFTQSAEFLAFSLSVVVGVWFAAWAIGLLVDLVKRV